MHYLPVLKGGYVDIMSSFDGQFHSVFVLLK